MRRSLRKIILFFVLALFLLVTSAYFLLPHVWDGKTKIATVDQKASGEVDVTVLDPGTPLITTIVVPGEVEVDASNQLGVWKLSSISKLGADKKLGGDFLKNTVLKSFGFPIDTWQGNLTLADKIRIAFFSLPLGNSGRTTVNLKDTSYLERTQLFDGTLGYRIGVMPTKLAAYFDRNSSGENLNVLIDNASSTSSEGVVVEKVVETMGLKVASIQNSDANNSDCKVIGARNDWVSQIARIFSCDAVLQKGSNNFDIEIHLGTKFKGRF